MAHRPPDTRISQIERELLFGRHKREFSPPPPVSGPGGPGTVVHNETTGKQGGLPGQYYHFGEIAHRELGRFYDPNWDLSGTYMAAGYVQQLSVSGNLGVGHAPVSTYAVWAELTGTAAATQYTGALGVVRVSGVGANYTSIMYGGFFQASYEDAGRTASHATSGLIGYQCRVTVAADNATVSNAWAICGRASTTAGTARAFTTVQLFRADTSLASGGSIGTLYGFYMPTCTGSTRWGIYIADTGANSYFGAPTQHATGSAAAPGVAGLAYTTTGLYWGAGPTLGIAVNGGAVATVTAAGIHFPDGIKAFFGTDNDVACYFDAATGYYREE